MSRLPIPTSAGNNVELHEEVMPLATVERGLTSDPGWTPWQTVNKHWRFLLLALLVSLPLAWAAGHWFGTAKWHIDSTLMYNPLSHTDATQAGYSPPTVNTFVALFTSPEVVSRVCDTHAPGPTPKQLEKRLKATQPNGSELVHVSLDWNDPHEGAALLSGVIAAHAEQLVSIRRVAVHDQMNLVKSRLEVRRRQLAHAQDKLDAFHRELKVRSVTRELEQTMSEVSALATAIGANRRKLATFEALKKTATTHLQNGDPDQALSAASELAPAAMIGSYEVRTDRILAGLREAQENLAVATKNWELKARDEREVRHLVYQRAMSQQEYEKLTGELELLVMKKRQAETQIRRYQKELEDMPMRKAAAGIKNLDTQAEQMRLEIGGADDALKAALAKSGSLMDVLEREKPLTEAVSHAKDEMQHCQRQVDALNQLETTAAREFSVLKPPEPPAVPTSTTRNLICVSVLLLCCGLAFTGASTLDHWRHQRTPYAMVQNLGARVLAPAPRRESSGELADRTAVDNQARSRLAFRVSREVSDCGRIVLFTSLNHPTIHRDVVREVSVYLGAREGRVLVLDARIGPPNRWSTSAADERTPCWPLQEPTVRPPVPLAGGLAEFLAQRDQELEALVRQTENPRVDYIPCGEPTARPELLASEAMSQLLRDVSDRYARILIIGPSAAQPLEVEMLASYADSVIVAMTQTDQVKRATAADFMESLREAGTPLTAVVVV
jgi:hypothetical protein